MSNKFPLRQRVRGPKIETAQPRLVKYSINIIGVVPISRVEELVVFANGNISWSMLFAQTVQEVQIGCDEYKPEEQPNDDGDKEKGDGSDKRSASRNPEDSGSSEPPTGAGPDLQLS